MTHGSTTVQKLKLGMIGGGNDAFIGAVHRAAAALDARFEFVAGALSSTPERALASARAIGLQQDRIYPTWKDMLEGERRRPESERIDVVSIVTPNNLHAEIALPFVEAGFHIICEKPMVTTSTQAAKLTAAVERSGIVFGVCYNYTGYPMVKEAAALVRSGAIGNIRKVFVEYHQGWLADNLESTGQKQASWRVDPARAGIGGAIGDIGTHAENLLTTVTGLRIESLCADITSFVPDRRLDDDASILLRLSNGAKAVLTVSQICIGEENNLSLRIHGDRGSLAWRQEQPNHLTICRADGSRQILARGGPGLAPETNHASRLPTGHPEGFIEAFANIYRAVADAVLQKRGLLATIPSIPPTVHDGARGVTFIEKVVQSAGAGATWVPYHNTQ